MSGSVPEPRVLHVDEQPRWRGGEQQMLYLARGLQERQVQTAVVLQPGAPAVARARQAGIPTHRVAMHGELDMAAAFRIARIARGGGFNVLHAHTAHAHSLIQAAAHLWMANCRVIAHRRIEFPVGRGLFGLGRLKYLLGVDAYIAISNRVKRTLMEAGVPEWRVFTIRSATDPARFAEAEPNPDLRSELGIPANAFVVGNIGALVGHKDHRTLLEACRIVRDRVPETWVVIVGDGPLREPIMDKARSLHMEDRLTLTGFRWDIPQLIQMFDLFALSSSEEGLCSTLLEVAAGGCPIVATDAGGVREAVLPDRTGLIVPTSSPRALAQGVLQMIEDPDLAGAMARRGRRRVERHFNAEVLTERTLGVYRRALAGEISPDRPVGFLAE